jgi:hypothetical protein
MSSKRRKVGLASDGPVVQEASDSVSGQADQHQRACTSVGALALARQQREEWAAQPILFTDPATDEVATIAWTLGDLSPPPPSCEGIPFDPRDRFNRLARWTTHVPATGTLTLASFPEAHLEFRVMLQCTRADFPDYGDNVADSPCWLQLERVMNIWHTFVSVTRPHPKMAHV